MSQSILGDDAKAQQLVQLLQALQSSDNVVRSQAETALNSQWVDEQPDALLLGLAEQIQRSPDVTVSAHGALLPTHGADAPIH